MKELKFTIQLNPITKKNSQRMFKNPRTGKMYPVPSEKYVQYERNCGYFVGKYRDLNIDEPINVKAEYYRDSKRRVDLCNLHEALCDMLVHYGVVKDDDSKIIAAMDGSRVYLDRDNPRTEVTITWL